MPKRFLVRTAKVITASVLGFSVGAIGYSVDRCQQTGRFRLLTTSPEEDIEIGNRMSHSLLSSLPRDLVLSASHPLVRICQRITDRIALASEAKNIRFEVVIVSDSSAKVIALPNGDIVMHAGLLATVNSELELARIIAREMARTIMRHSSEVVTFSDLARIPSGILYSVGVLRWLAVRMAAKERRLTDFPSSSKLEQEADSYAQQLLDQAGYSDVGISEELKYWTGRISSQV